MASLNSLRVHCQHRPGYDGIATIAEDDYRAAARRHPDIASHVEISFGLTPEALRQGMATADVLVGTAGVIRASFPIAAPRLKWIFTTSAGVDKLVPFDWAPPGVQVANNSGAHGRKAAEFAQMALLMLHTRMQVFAANQREKRWHKIFSSSIAGRTLVVVGLGGIGGAAAEGAKRLGMTVIGVRNRQEAHAVCDRVVETSRLDEVLPLADYLLIALPLTPATTRLFDRRRLDLLKSGAGLINIARGRVIDNDAVADKLDRDELSGAVLDVFDQEPLAADSRLWSTRNLIITPHVSSEDSEMHVAHTLDIFFEHVRCWLAGKPLPNLIDAMRGY
jgi:glyoxylate/hydroxypyruvate reductase A